ncbi:hypothetical protein YC2023_041145 [Brassica napus]
MARDFFPPSGDASERALLVHSSQIPLHSSKIVFYIHGPSKNMKAPTYLAYQSRQTPFAPRLTSLPVKPEPEFGIPLKKKRKLTRLWC